LAHELRAKFGEADRQNRHLPAVVVAADVQAQRAPDDLMPETHADDAHAALLEDFLNEINQPQDPRGVVERIVFCALN
jgi:hypothetical protein